MRILLILFGLSFLVVLGCDSPTAVETPQTYQLSYTEDFYVAMKSDALSIVSESQASPNMQEPSVTVSGPPQFQEDSLHFVMQIAGEANSPDEKPVIGYKWTGDTLRVFCVYVPDVSIGTNDPVEASLSMQPYFALEHLEIEVPAGVEVEYLGHDVR